MLNRTGRVVVVLGLAVTLGLSGRAGAETGNSGGDASGGGGGASGGLVPFVLPWDDDLGGVTNVGRVLRGEKLDGVQDSTLKGAEGEGAALTPLRVGADGHLWDGRGRVRLFGVNVCFGACFPEKWIADKIAARMAKFGINIVRFHHMDSFAYPDGILPYEYPILVRHKYSEVRQGRILGVEALDRLDYFIAALKRNGIYADLNLLVSREFSVADGLPAAIGQMPVDRRRLMGFFYEPIEDAEKAYARELLAHENPYTHSTYAQEPAVGLVEIVNENGLIHGWLGNELDGLPPVVGGPLQVKWNAWLAKRYANEAAMNRAWGTRREPLGEEMIRNVEQREGSQDWSLEQHEGAEATLEEVDAGASGKSEAGNPKAEATPARLLRLHVTRPGQEGWHVQMNQGGLKLEKDRVYTISFLARSDRPATMVVNVGQAHGPWKLLGLESPIALSPRWSRHTLLFSATADDANGRLNFSGLGKQPGEYELAEISFRPGGSAGLDEGESLANRSVPCLEHAAPRLWSRAAKEDYVRFLIETEGSFWDDMSNFLKKDLGVRAPLVGTIVGTSTPHLAAKLDVIDSHDYWQHPQFPGRPWDEENWLVKNVSMVNDAGAALTPMAWEQVVGKPHIVTEYNHPSPNTHSSEAPLLLAAEAALQDWDGIFLFAYSHRREWDTKMFPNFFDIDQHPTKMANVAAAALLFRRGDVAAGKELLTLDLPTDAEPGLALRGGAWGPITPEALGIDRNLALWCRTALRLTKDGPLRTSPVESAHQAAGHFASDTKEVIWDAQQTGRGTFEKGTFTVNSPRSKVFVGFADGRAYDLGGVKFSPEATRQGWCTIALTLVEGESFNRPGRALLVATGDTENTNMVWKSAARESVGKNWGQAPSLVEVVPTSIELPAGLKEVRAWALDEWGMRAKELKIEPLNPASGRTTIRIGATSKTIWYELEWK